MKINREVLKTAQEIVSKPFSLNKGNTWRLTGPADPKKPIGLRDAMYLSSHREAQIERAAWVAECYLVLSGVWSVKRAEWLDEQAKNSANVRKLLSKLRIEL